MTDWLILGPVRTGNEMRRQVPGMLADPEITVEQVKALFSALEQQAQFSEKLKAALEGLGYDFAIVDKAGELEERYVDLAAAAAETLKDMRSRSLTKMTTPQRQGPCLRPRSHEPPDSRTLTADRTTDPALMVDLARWRGRRRLPTTALERILDSSAHGDAGARTRQGHPRASPGAFRRRRRAARGLEKATSVGKAEKAIDGLQVVAVFRVR